MKYGMTRWLAMAIAVTGLSVSGCSRSSENTAGGTPLDRFTDTDGGTNEGSGVAIKDSTGLQVANITAPAYGTNPLVTPEQIIPTRATTTSVSSSSRFSRICGVMLSASSGAS